jgi:hypothetical protein
MTKTRKPYWNARESFDWIVRAGFEGQAVLDQLQRAIREEELEVTGRKGHWGADYDVSYEERTTIPQPEALDLVLVPGPNKTLHLLFEKDADFFEMVKLYDDDGAIDPDNIQFTPNSMISRNDPAASRRDQPISWGWFNLFFRGRNIMRLWPHDGRRSGAVSKIEREQRTQAWLERLMKAGGQSKPKAEYRREAIDKYGVSALGFDQVWKAARDGCEIHSWRSAAGTRPSGSAKHRGGPLLPRAAERCG